MALNLETCGLRLSKVRSGIPIALSFKYSLSNGEKVEEHFRLWPTCGMYSLISHSWKALSQGSRSNMLIAFRNSTRGFIRDAEQIA
jgi:ABC-type molybdenum transport system ATPase subunit/photorepair protein PhrA